MVVADKLKADLLTSKVSALLFPIYFALIATSKKNKSPALYGYRDIMLTTIATYSFPYEGQIAKAKLDSEGIPAYIADEHTINMQWLYSNALGGIRLQVPEVFVQQAIELLAEDFSNDVELEQGSDTISCSACGSSNMEPYQVGKRWAFLVFIGLSFRLFPVKNTLRCRDCGHVEEGAT